MTLDTLPVLLAATGYFIGTIPVAVRNSVPVISLPVIESDGSVLPALHFEYNETFGYNPAHTLEVLLGVAKGLTAVMIARFSAVALGADVFPAIALCAVFVVLGDCFPFFWRTAHRRGISVAAGAALGINILPVILFIIMFMTGYFVIRRAKAVGSIGGALGTVVLMLAAPKNLLYLTSTVEGTEIVKLKTIAAVVALAIFVRHIQPMQAVFRRDDGTPVE